MYLQICASHYVKAKEMDCDWFFIVREKLSAREDWVLDHISNLFLVFSFLKPRKSTSKRPKKC